MLFSHTPIANRIQNQIVNSKPTTSIFAIRGLQRPRLRSSFPSQLLLAELLRTEPTDDLVLDLHALGEVHADL